jgi:hypothetical protein
MEVVNGRVPLGPTISRRIASVLRQHALVFGDGLVVRDPAVKRECAELLGALEHLDDAQASRVASIIRQHALIFGPDRTLDVDGGARDDPELIEALFRQAKPPPPPEPAAPPPAPPPPRPEPIPIPVPPPPPVRKAPRVQGPLGEAEIRLFGPGRRTSIGEERGLLLFLHFDAAAGRGAVLFVPLGSVAEARVEAEPVEVTVSGPCHCVLVEHAASVASRIVPSEWRCALPLPFGLEDLYAVRLHEGGRILLSAHPSAGPSPSRIVGATDRGVYGYFIPPGARALDRIVGLVRMFLKERAGVPGDIPDGVAWFACRRLMGFGFSRALRPEPGRDGSE